MLTNEEVIAVKKAVHGLRSVHYGLENAHHRLRKSNQIYEDLTQDIGETRAKELWSEICQAAKEV